jgi:competence protein ComEC
MDPETNTFNVFVLIFGFISGVLVSSFVFIAPLVSVFLIFVGLAVLAAEKVWNQNVGREVLFIVLAFFSFGLGALRYSIKDFHEPLVPAFTGVVISEPEEKENTTRFILRSANGEKLLVSTDLYSAAVYGDEVKVEGRLEEPGLIMPDDGGRPFDYAKYLSKDDIYFTLNFAEVEILSHGHGSAIKRGLFELKRSFIAKIKEILIEPHSSLLAGLIVSGRGALPKDILENFRRAGVIHIVVLSGYNITIIAEFLRKLLENFFLVTRFRVTPRVVSGVSILGIILFVLMTGAEPTVVRAAMMALAVIAAKMFGRRYSAFRALLVAGTLMVVENPKILVFDPSFQLSFIAMLALIYLVPIVDLYLHGVPEKWGLRLTLATTISTQIAVLPLLIYSMGDFSLVSLFSNMLILLIIPVAMFVGFIAALLSYLSAAIALPFSYAAYLLLAWILRVSDYFGNLSFASVTVPPIAWWVVVLIYLAMIIFVRHYQNFLQWYSSSD